MNEKRKWKRLIIASSAFTIWAIMVAMWAYVWMTFYGHIIIRPFGYKGNWLVYMLYGGILLCFNLVYGGYKVGHYKRGDVLFSNVLAMIFTNGITYVQTCLLRAGIIDPMPLLIMSCVDVVIISIWASLSCKLYIKLNPPRDMLVVYGGNHLAESLIYKMTKRSEKYNICQVVSIDEGLDTVCEMMLRYDSVIICDVGSACRNTLLKFCFVNSIRTYLTPKISDVIVRGASNINLFDTPLLLCKNRGLTVEQRFFKRMLDILVSAIGIVVLSPFMLGTALVIKLQDDGPVLFKQERCTIDNKIFKVLKFRSMIVDAEKDGVARLATEGDSRITKVGKFIRATRLDELPQLLNILKGEMSIVGPRPERPEIAKEYEQFIPEFCFRLKVKAGLTGYAQVVGKYNTTPYDKLKMDLMYIENYSFFEDIKLILMTVKIMFMKESIEGFVENTEASVDYQHQNTTKNT